MNHISVALLLRLGLGVTFLYAGIAGIAFPADWVGFLPAWIDSVLDINTALLLFSLLEIILAVWLFSGWQTRIAAAISALLLLGIVVSSFRLFIITFRDVGLLFAALALWRLSSHHKT